MRFVGILKIQSFEPYIDMGNISSDALKPASDIYKKAQDQTLPNGITFETVKAHALAAIRYSYNTHTANKVTLCTNSLYSS